MLIERKLEQARRNLLELSTRNRLLNMPRRKTRVKTVEIVDKRSDDIFRILVTEGKQMGFLPVSEEREETLDQDALMTQPTGSDESRRADNQLPSRLDSKQLQKRLLSIYYDARTSLEETGINILYLALGALKWFEAEEAVDERYAPLLLIPVELTRESAKERFKLKWSGEELSSNLSLSEKMRIDFGLDLPQMPDMDDLILSRYFSNIRECCAGMSRWEVLGDDLVLGFYSFAKLLMYHDLDPKAWPEEHALQKHQLIESLLVSGFSSEIEPVCSEDTIDECVAVEHAIHIADADSSQTVAIEEVKAGRNLVIQGPPGTGKSQTITNLIAAAVARRQKVLFVAEKLAALEVVKRRLDERDLGSICLELHSRKANKKTFLDELRRTLELGLPAQEVDEPVLQKLAAVRSALDEFCETLHKIQRPSGMTAYRITSKLIRLYGTDKRIPDFELREAAGWTADEHRRNWEIVAELAARAKPIHPPSQHPWRGVQIETLLPSDKHRLNESINQALELADNLCASAERLCATVGCTDCVTARDILRVLMIANHITGAPSLDWSSMSDAAWIERKTDIEHAVVTGERYAALVAILQQQITDSAWHDDVRAARDSLSRNRNSVTRFWRRDYRDAVKRLRSLLRIPMPKSLKARLQILENIVQFQEQWHALASVSNLGRAVFGSSWCDHESDWSALRSIAHWRFDCENRAWSSKFLKNITTNLNKETIVQLSNDVRNALEKYRTAVEKIFTALRLNLEQAFGCAAFEDINLSTVRGRFGELQNEFETLPSWAAFMHQLGRARSCGLTEIGSRLFDGRLTPDDASVAFDKVRLEAVLRSVVAEHPILSSFSAAAHERQIAEFRKLDLARIDLARRQVALAHYREIPHFTTGSGALGLLQREIHKKRAHLPIRKVMEKAGIAIQNIKPVFMMSPLSVAQFLSPGAVNFDLILIDEASQVEPVDALGAMARAKQVVIVGDDRQLPPSRFFTKIHAGETGEEENEEEFQAENVESVLGLCLAQGMQNKMLRWHYRSRHHSLIKVSNEQFYENRLLVAPSALEETPEAGVKFRFVSEGVFDRGGLRTNAIEASAVAKAVIEHARQSPSLTLGVGAFSLPQREAILAELELLRRSERDVEDFFHAHPHEPFFVKNLENIQGDERDVIFISVGYARDESGYMAMNFGPLSIDGGERRLNVLITRARSRCDVFSSITADDIDLERGRSRGVAAFKSYLHFAQTGHTQLGISNVRELDSPFEEEVHRALTQLGYDVVGQVGVAGFFVDLAVRDPEKTGRFIIGIECDGASYHSCHSARDRDRLRQQVLEDQGWLLHRIWSTDWLRSPEESLRRTVSAIEAAKIRWSERDQSLGRGEIKQNATSSGCIARVEPEIKYSVGELVGQPYKEAALNIDTHFAPHEISIQRMSSLVEQIVIQEGPIHRDEICRRVSSVWHLQRTGSRIAAAVNTAIDFTVRHDKLVSGDGFVDIPDRKVSIVRDRAHASASLRRPEMLPPSEIHYALSRVVELHCGINEQETVQQVARAFGFASTSEALRERITAQLKSMVEAGSLRIEGETIRPS